MGKGYKWGVLPEVRPLCITVDDLVLKPLLHFSSVVLYKKKEESLHHCKSVVCTNKSFPFSTLLMLFTFSFVFGCISVIFTTHPQHPCVLVRLFYAAGNHFSPSKHFYLQIKVFFLHFSSSSTTSLNLSEKWLE